MKTSVEVAGDERVLPQHASRLLQAQGVVTVAFAHQELGPDEILLRPNVEGVREVVGPSKTPLVTELVGIEDRVVVDEDDRDEAARAGYGRLLSTGRDREGGEQRQDPTARRQEAPASMWLEATPLRNQKPYSNASFGLHLTKAI